MSRHSKAQAPGPTPLTLEVIRGAMLRSSRCTLATFLADLPPAERQVVRDAIADVSIHATAIARALRKRGYRYSGQVILRHRQRDPECPDCAAVNATR